MDARPRPVALKGLRRRGLRSAHPPMADRIRPVALDGLRSAVILGALALVVALRWAATVSGSADALLVGLVFGLALTVVARAAGVVARPPRMLPLLAGIVGGLTLVGAALVNREPGLDLGLRPAAPFVQWAAVTILVAMAEELVLRGAAFAALGRLGGSALAVGVTTVAFALMHVPLYGWHVVPLDLGVGVFLGGLRLVSRGIVAPAVAHAVADLATWWL